MYSFLVARVAKTSSQKRDQNIVGKKGCNSYWLAFLIIADIPTVILLILIEPDKGVAVPLVLNTIVEVMVEQGLVNCPPVPASPVRSVARSVTLTTVAPAEALSFWLARSSLCNCRHPGPRRVWDGGSDPRVLPPLPRLPRLRWLPWLR